MPLFQPIGKPKWCEKINLSFGLNVEHFAIRRNSIPPSGYRKYHWFIYRRVLLLLSSLIKLWVDSYCHFFSHAVFSFVFIYLECGHQDCRFLKILLNGRNRLQLWRKYNKTKTVYFDLFPFYSEVRRQTGGVSRIVWMIYYWLTSWLASHWA